MGNGKIPQPSPYNWNDNTLSAVVYETLLLPSYQYYYHFFLFPFPTQINLIGGMEKGRNDNTIDKMAVEEANKLLSL